MKSIGSGSFGAAQNRFTSPGPGAFRPRARMRWRVWAYVQLLVLLGGFAFSARASHFRYVTLSWSLSTNSAGEVVFDLTGSFRRSTYFGSAADGRPQIGDIITE